MSQTICPMAFRGSHNLLQNICGAFDDGKHQEPITFCLAPVNSQIQGARLQPLATGGAYETGYVTDVLE
jgi:hypothetical protein